MADAVPWVALAGAVGAACASSSGIVVGWSGAQPNAATNTMAQCFTRRFYTALAQKLHDLRHRLVAAVPPLPSADWPSGLGPLSVVAEARDATRCTCFRRIEAPTPLGALFIEATVAPRALSPCRSRGCPVASGFTTSSSTTPVQATEAVVMRAASVTVMAARLRALRLPLRPAPPPRAWRLVMVGSSLPRRRCFLGPPSRFRVTITRVRCHAFRWRVCGLEHC